MGGVEERGKRRGERGVEGGRRRKEEEKGREGTGESRSGGLEREKERERENESKYQEYASIRSPLINIYPSLRYPVISGPRVRKFRKWGS